MKKVMLIGETKDNQILTWDDFKLINHDGKLLDNIKNISLEIDCGDVAVLKVSRFSSNYDKHFKNKCKQSIKKENDIDIETFSFLVKDVKIEISDQGGFGGLVLVGNESKEEIEKTINTIKENKEKL